MSVSGQANASSDTVTRPLDLAGWGYWVAVVESGTTPLRATRLVLSGTEPARGVIVWDDGTIQSTDDV